MKQLVDYIPLILFIIVYKMEERLIQFGEYTYTLGGVFSATEILMSATVLMCLAFYIKNKALTQFQLIALIAILLFGSVTIILRDEDILKWKAPVVNWIFAGIFVASHFIGEKNAIERMLGHTAEMPQERWNRLNFAWAGFFLFLGCINLFVAFTFHDYWVDFKVFGSMALIFLFSIGQIVYIYPFLIEDDDESQDTKNIEDTDKTIETNP